ncbi:unnamed protein product [Closterium sp. Naga37s-1]|nr:unnamed protein product [Closterium sp. Naga37s-1]
MQQYGQSGSHLKELFEGVFAEDYALTFRWTPVSRAPWDRKDHRVHFLLGFLLSQCLPSGGLLSVVLVLWILEAGPVRVVYVGHSESVRSRMQQYGQSGSHLKELFEGVFAQDYALTFRWISAVTKAEAAATETLLLSSFDYVWNVSNNHHRRHDRLLTKLQVGPSFSRRVAVAFPFLPVARLVTPVAVGPAIPLAAAAAAPLPPDSPTAPRAASPAAASRPDIPSAIDHANYSAAKPQDKQRQGRSPGTPPGSSRRTSAVCRAQGCANRV